MAEPGRLDLVKQSLGVMTDRLRDDDSLALVTFSDEAETVLPMTRVGDDRGRVHDAIDSLEPMSSTNLGAGVAPATTPPSRACARAPPTASSSLSDALANTGDTDADAILDRIADARREHGITLFGVGVGSDYGDALMERLADKGDGHTTYVSNAEEARKVFCDELPQNIDLTARDAKAQVAFDPETVQQFRLIGYDDRQVADDDFRDDRVDGGEVGPGHTVTALYAVRIRPGRAGTSPPAVRWLDPDTRAPHEETGQMEAGASTASVGTSATGLQVTAVAAYFADALRQGDNRWTRLPGSLPLNELRPAPTSWRPDTEDKAVRELADAIEPADWGTAGAGALWLECAGSLAPLRGAPLAQRAVFCLSGARGTAHAARHTRAALRTDLSLHARSRDSEELHDHAPSSPAQFPLLRPHRVRSESERSSAPTPRPRSQKATRRQHPPSSRVQLGKRTAPQGTPERRRPARDRPSRAQPPAHPGRPRAHAAGSRLSWPTRPPPTRSECAASG